MQINTILIKIWQLFPFKLQEHRHRQHEFERPQSLWLCQIPPLTTKKNYVVGDYVVLWNLKVIRLSTFLSFF